MEENTIYRKNGSSWKRVSNSWTLIYLLLVPSHLSLKLKTIWKRHKMMDRKLIDKKKEGSYERSVFYSTLSFVKRAIVERENKSLEGKNHLSWIFLSLSFSSRVCESLPRLLLRVASSSTYFDSAIYAHLLFFFSMICRIKSIRNSYFRCKIASYVILSNVSAWTLRNTGTW